MITPQNMLDAVVSIGIRIPNSDPFWTGTGFIVSQKIGGSDNNLRYYLITNKHVVKRYKKIVIRFNLKGEPPDKDYDILLIDENGNKWYSEHPDENSDVIACEINTYSFIEDKTIWLSFDLDQQALTLEQMEKKYLHEGSLVYALGFPMGIVDFKNTPIFRLGCISRIRDAYALKHEHPTFLVDAQTFPGNSGGPIINKQEIIIENGKPMIIDSHLVGILSNYISYHDLLYSKQTDRIKMDLEENSGITIVHPVDRIKEVVELEYKRLHQNINSETK